MPDDDDDFEIELDWEEEEVLLSKYQVGDKVVAVGSYMPGGDRAVAVVTIKDITTWEKVSRVSKGLVYVVKREWGDQLAMSVTKTITRKKMKLFVAVDDMYYVDPKDLHQLKKERTTKSIRNRLFPPKRKRGKA